MTSWLSMEEEEILDICARIEDKAEEIYLFLTDAHNHSHRISALWKKTALEEQNHARHFRFSRRSKDEMVASVKMSQAKAEDMLSLAKATLDQIKRDRPEVESALAITIRLEETLLNFHMAYAVEFVEQSYKNLFQAMMAADNGHIESLRQALREITGGRAPYTSPKT